jgi:hypothetical protein
MSSHVSIEMNSGDRTMAEEKARSLAEVTASGMSGLWHSTALLQAIPKQFSRLFILPQT